MTERVESRTTAYLSALIVRGADVNLWSALEERRSEFDELLASDPTALPGGVDDEEMELRRLLGVA